MRQGLALLRLFLLYGSACFLVLATGLLQQSDQEAGAGLGAPATFPDVKPPFLGVTVRLDAHPDAEDAVQLSELRRAGFGWARQRFDWGELEPQPGAYAWSAADAWVDAIVAAGLEPVVLLDGSPAWTRAPQDQAPTANPFAPPADAATFARFAGAFAARYGERVRIYQIWDEPNIAPHWGNRHVEPVAYAQLLKAAAAAIRQADPDAVILTAVLAPTADRGHTAIDEVYFLQRLIAAGAAPAFDAVAIQPFGFGHGPDDPRQAPAVLDFQRAAWIRRALVAAGQGEKPLWAMRFGWNREPQPWWGVVTPAAQAAYAQAALTIGWRDWPWLAAMGWPADRPTEDTADPLQGFALFEPTGEPAPVWQAIRTWTAARRMGEDERPVNATVAAAPTVVNRRAETQSPLERGWARMAMTWGGLLVAALFVGWRSVAAARLLPWVGWVGAYRRAPRWVHGVAWGGLLVAYYFAVWPPLIGLCWLLWGLLCWAQPLVGLAVAATLLPFFYQHKELPLVGRTLTIPPAVAGTLCLTPAVIARYRTRKIPVTLVDWPVFALLGLSLLAAGTVWQWEAYGNGLLVLVFVPVLLWAAVRALVRDAQGLQTIAGALFLGGLLAALWGLGAWTSGNGTVVDGVRRLVGPHYSPNHTALYLVRTLFLGLGITLAAARWQRWWLLAATGFVLLTLVLTGSRGALVLGLPAGALTFGWLALRRRPGLVRWLRLRKGRVRWLLALLGLMIVGAALLLWERLLNVETAFVRIDIWEATLRLWRDHLLVGVGPGSFFWTYPAYLAPGAPEPNQLHPHNLWLELAATWGALGFFWLGALLLTWQSRLAVARSAPASAYWIAAGAVAGLIAGIAHGQIDAFFLLADLAAWNTMAWALATEPK